MKGSILTFIVGVSGILGIVFMGFTSENSSHYNSPVQIQSEREFDLLYSFEDRNRHEWIGSNHFEGFSVTSEWSSEGSYSLMGMLMQQSTTYFEPEMTKVYLNESKDYSGYKSIAVDVRHQAGDCDPGGGLFARIYITGVDMEMIGISDQYPIGDWTQTLVINLPEDLRDGLDANSLKEVTRLSVQFLPCDTSTGNIEVYIDNVRGYYQ